MGNNKLGFGGGCHWCTEAVFASLKGVSKVEQGWIKSTPPNDSFSEAVIVHFDDTLISIDILLEIHVRTHSATSRHSLREKYRSAVYFFNRDDVQRIGNVLDRLQADFGGRLITEILPFVAFKPSLPEHQNYYASDPDKPFCKLYIDPKLAMLRERFSHHYNADN